MPGQLGLFEKEQAPEVVQDHPDQDGLRYYQRECVDKVIRAFDYNRAVLAVLATGLGKTQIFSAIVKHWPGPTLVLAHRSELVDQAAKRLEQMTGELVEIDQAQVYSGFGRIIVASVQTVSRPARLQRIKDMWEQKYPTEVPLIIADEAHHYVAKSYRRPLDGIPHAKVLGVTATPSRSDMKALGRIFDDYPFVMEIDEGIEQGWLVPIDAREVTVNQVNLDNVDSVAGDLNQGQLDEEMLKAAEIVAQEVIRLSGDRQGIVFCPGVKSAHLAAEKFNALKPYSAACVDGKTPKLERERITRDFRDGKTQYLVNCQVATEGFDAPGCSTIALMRCTKSLGMYKQMLGRGLRCLPNTVDRYHKAEQSAARRASIENSTKPNCLVLDFVGVGKRHKLVSAMDVLGGKYTDDEIQKAKKLKKEKPAADNEQCLREARNILRKLAEASKASVKSTVTSFDPFRVMHIDRGSESELKGMKFGHQPLTAKQKEYLQEKKVPENVIKGMSKADYTRFLQAMHARHKKGLATYRQLAFLQKYGFHEVNVSFRQAKKGLDYIAKMGWGRRGRISPDKLASIMVPAGKTKLKVG